MSGAAFSDWIDDLAAQIAGARASAAACEGLAELVDARLDGPGDLILRLVRFRLVGFAAGQTPHTGVSLEITEQCELLMAAVRAVRADLGGLEVQLRHLLQVSGDDRASDGESGCEVQP